MEVAITSPTQAYKRLRTKDARGPYLSNDPTTIQGFVSDLIGTPGDMYNSSPNWPISIEGGNWVNGAKQGQPTIGTYQSALNALKLCNITLN